MFKLLRKQKSWLGKLVVAALLITLISPCLAEANDLLNNTTNLVEASLDQTVVDDFKKPVNDINIDQDIDGHCCMSHGVKMSFDTHQTFLFSLEKTVVAMQAQQSLPNDFLLGLFRPPQA